MKKLTPFLLSLGLASVTPPDAMATPPSPLEEAHNVPEDGIAKCTEELAALLNGAGIHVDVLQLAEHPELGEGKDRKIIVLPSDQKKVDAATTARIEQFVDAEAQKGIWIVPGETFGALNRDTLECVTEEEFKLRAKE